MTTIAVLLDYTVTTKAAPLAKLSISHFMRIAATYKIVPSRARGSRELVWTDEQIKEIAGRKKR